MKLQCVICDSEDFDLLSLKLPVRGEKRPVGVIFCCKKCKPKLWQEINGYKEIILLGLSLIKAAEDSSCHLDVF